jgi:PAS domain S-box-containing protein
MNKPLRVLIVEDSEDDTLFMLRELKQGGFDPAFERVETSPALTSALDRQTWDIVISDHSLPGFGSLNALELLKEKNLDIPFIIVSGTIGEDVAVKAMKAGASDYVMKNQLKRLVPSIERELRDAWGRRSHRRAEEALRRSEQELNDFFEHACVGLHWAGPDGTILRANQAEWGMLGYKQEEYSGHSISEFYVDESRADVVLERLHRGESLNDYEVRLRCKSGEIKHVLINANVLWEKGKFIHSRCFTRDITDRKREEDERLKLISELTEALTKIKTLRGLLPICASCKKIRDDRGYWKKIESYICEHTEAQFTHGICPDCLAHLYPEYVSRQ